jgi:hypothetical protein
VAVLPYLFNLSWHSDFSAPSIALVGIAMYIQFMLIFIAHRFIEQELRRQWRLHYLVHREFPWLHEQDAQLSAVHGTDPQKLDMHLIACSTQEEAVQTLASLQASLEQFEDQADFWQTGVSEWLQCCHMQIKA